MASSKDISLTFKRADRIFLGEFTYNVLKLGLPSDIGLRTEYDARGFIKVHADPELTTSKDVIDIFRSKGYVEF